MPSTPIVVLDTNVWISGVFFRHGIPARILRAWQDGHFEIVVNSETLWLGIVPPPASSGEA